MNTDAHISSAFVSIRLFASLGSFMPESPDTYPITPGITISELLGQLGVPLSQAKLVFVNNLGADTNTKLYGGERVGVFPPVGGG